MLINDLVNAYDRLVKNPLCEINQNGFCFGFIENLAIIDKNGTLKEIIVVDKPAREKLPENLCPGGVKKNILYDTFEFFFGLRVDNGTFALSIDGKSKCNKFDSFKKANLELLEDVDSDIARAIVNFITNWNPEENTNNQILYVKKEDGTTLPRIYKGSIAFCLDSITQKCYQNPPIISKIERNILEKNENTDADGVCCISGKVAKIAQKHKSFSGSQNYLISVDNDTKSFHSYGKTWCYDSPVSEEIMNKYTSVLNYFYRNGSKNKTSLGEDVLMFWADCDDGGCEDETLALLGQTPTQDMNKEVENKVSSALSQIKQGVPSTAFKTSEDTNFYLLLLSKNSARISVRKYHRTTFGTFRDNVLQHYLDMDIVGIDKPIPIWQLLSSTVSSTSNDKPNPSFCGALTDAILNNSGYPSALFAEMILRIKTDNPNLDMPLKRSAFIGATNRRIAFIKAYLVRKNRLENKKEDIKMSLNLESKNEAYLLGRLFAVLEKTQQDAIPGANSTIKDRYFASACSTPASVFPILLRGYQNHIAKLEQGTGRYEKLVAEIFDRLDETLPKQLDLNDQGRFAIGYYQQRTSLWTKQTNSQTIEI